MVLKTVIIKEFQDLIDKLEKDITILEAQGKKKEGDGIKYKIRTFQKVIQSLKNCDQVDITDSAVFKNSPGIGKGSLARIDEIIKSGGKLDEAHTEFNPNDLKIIKDIQDLETITGIGPSHAVQFRKEGLTLQLLKNEYNKYTNQQLKLEDSTGIKLLTHHQLIGLKYYDEIQKRIPRNEIDAIWITINQSIQKYNTEHNSNIEGKICGSYRRGCVDSGDIDLLIKEDTSFNLIDFVHFLTLEHILIDHLTEKGTTKYMGITFNKHRIDIRCVAKECWGATLMYFTGSKTFNTLVRAKALELGYTLDEYGVSPLLDPKKDETELKKRKKQSHSHQHLKGTRIDCPTEEKIFELLKIDTKYLDPSVRDLKDNITSL
jgi:DNA polymerase beta